MDVSVYNERIMGPMHVEPATHLACRTALAYRGVTHITMPVDMQSLPNEGGPQVKAQRACDDQAKAVQIDINRSASD